MASQDELDARACVADAFADIGADALVTLPGGAAQPVKVVPMLRDVSELEDIFPVAALATAKAFRLNGADFGERPPKGTLIELLDDAGVVSESWTLVEPAQSRDMWTLEWICIVRPSA